MRRMHEDAGVTVEGRADVGAAPHGDQDRIGDGLVNVQAGSTELVVLPERARIRAQALQPGLRERVGDQVEDFVGLLECRAYLSGQLDASLDPRPDDGE